MADKAFTSLPNITPTGATEVATVDGGVWKKFPVSGIPITDGAVTSAKIADGAVTTAKIPDAAVTSAKMANSGVTAGTYGSATQSPQFTVNSKGIITAVTNTGIATGSTITEYDAANTGVASTRTVRVTATGGGVTFEHPSVGNMVISVPTGVKLIGVRIFDTTGSVANMTITIAYIANTTTHQSLATAQIPCIALTRSSGVQIVVGLTASNGFINASFAATGGNLILTITNGNSCWTAGCNFTMTFP